MLKFSTTKKEFLTPVTSIYIKLRYIKFRIKMLFLSSPYNSNKGNVLSKYGISYVKKTEKDGTLTYYGQKKKV